MTDDQRTSRKRRSSVVTLVIEAICNADVSTTSQASIRECKPDGYFSNPVYGFDGLQTRVPGFDYVSPAGGRYSTVSGHLSEADSRVVDYKLRGGRRLNGS